MISGAKSSEQNDDKTNNLDDVILCQVLPQTSTSMLMAEVPPILPGFLYPPL